MKRIVLGHSGGLETAVAIARLREEWGAEVVAVTLDLGRARALEHVRDLALAAGAVRAHVLDVREEFACEYLLRALRADAVRGEPGPAVAALARPLVARRLLEVTEIERATAIAHGCAGSSAGQIPLEAAIRALNPAMTVIAPIEQWRASEKERAEYARARGITVAVDADTGATAIARPAAEPAFVQIAFDHGVPVAINGVEMPFVELLTSLGTIAGAHGVLGIETVLQVAHRELQRIATTGETRRFRRSVTAEYIAVIDKGLWFTPLREALDACIDKIQESVTGVVHLRLFETGYSVIDAQLDGAAPHARISSRRTAAPSLAGARP